MARSLLDSNSLGRRDFLRFSAGASVGLAAILAGCGSNSTTGSASSISLKTYAWFAYEKGAADTTLYTKLRNEFHKAHSNITVSWDGVTTDQYESTLRTRLVGGNAPDIFSVFPGAKMYPYAQAGYITDLSKESWTTNLIDAALNVSKYKDKVYGLPTGPNTIGVVYNKNIFQKLNLQIPTNWNEFLSICDKIKKANLVPLALGIKDQWVDQLIPYAMAPSAIYAQNPNFDDQMYAGKVTFVNSPWKQMMQDYMDLQKRGYFQPGVLGTDYTGATKLLATGKAAMVVQGSWLAGQTDFVNNPAATVGMFPLPYTDGTKPVWVPFSIGALLSVSTHSQHIDAAKQFLSYLAQPKVVQEGGGYSPFKNTPVNITGGAGDMIPYLKVGSYPFLDTKWPAGVQDSMLKDIQGVFAGTTTIDQMLSNMDQAFQKNKASVTG